MSYSIELIKKEDQKTSAWSGGTTTELFIYPKNTEYKKLNFGWRLSSAKVIDEESTFSHLPNIWRYIMVLNGSLKLIHENHHSLNLSPFEVDSFSGDWTTKSYGKVTDFNLMLNKDYTGNIDALYLKKDIKFSIDKNLSHVEAFYTLEEGTYVSINEEEHIKLDENDLLIITFDKDNSKNNISIYNNLKDSKLIRSSIDY
ncbi:HutD family protein [Clostridium tetani]|uniref:HutD/Ves family protein n=1 Tax=Clostridium tetani TaxID=1513 RepID=UPI0013E97CB6|nr:HutD family protein [Clostridium tetani]